MLKVDVDVTIEETDGYKPLKSEKVSASPNMDEIHIKDLLENNHKLIYELDKNNKALTRIFVKYAEEDKLIKSLRVALRGN